MGFIDYLWELAPNFLKRGQVKENSDIYKFAQGIGPVFDDVMNDIFLIRSLSLIGSATGKALDYHGINRNILRIDGESDADYRLRLLAAFDIYAEGGTEAGVKKVLSTLGYPNAEVYQFYKEKYKETPNPDYVDKWSEFVVQLITLDTYFLKDNYYRVKQVINQIKPAESLLYAIAIDPTWDFLDTQDLTWDQLDAFDFRWDIFESFI